MKLLEQLTKAHELVALNNKEITLKRTSSLGGLTADLIITDDFLWHSYGGEQTLENMADDIEARLEDGSHALEAIEQLGEEVAMVTDKFISTLRRDVTPAIAEFTTLITNNLEALDAAKSDWLKDIKIKIVDAPDPIVDFTDVFRPTEYADKTHPKGWRVSYAFAPRESLHTQDEIFALLQTGMEDFDKSLHTWLATVDTALLAEVNELIFAQSVSIESIKRWFGDRSNLNGLDAATFVFLYADRLSREPSTMATGVSAPQYIRDVLMLKDIAGIHVSRGLFAIKASVNGKLMVVKRTHDKCIHVIGSLFEEYKAAGGTTKSLIGNLLRDTKDKSLDEMISKIFTDTTDYDTIVRLRNATDAKSRSSTVRTLAYNSFVSMMNGGALTELEREYNRGNTTGFIDLTIQNARKAVNALTDGDTMDINRVALVIITRSRFFFTDAEKYLSSMVDIKNSEPDLTIDEVRTLSTMQYISRYLATQIQVTQVY